MTSEVIGMASVDSMSARDMTSAKDMMSAGGNMKNDELDRMLSKQDDIQPSSGFAVSVMEAVRSEASAPPPIPFPWKRALPALLVAAAALVAVVVAGVATIVNVSGGAAAPEVAASLSSSLSMITPHAQGGVGADLAWTAAALLAAFMSVKLSMRLVSGRV